MTGQALAATAQDIAKLARDYRIADLMAVAVEAPQGELRREALRRVAPFEPDGLDALLVAALADRAGVVRREAAQLLTQRGEAAVESLAAGLRDPDRAPSCAALLTTSAGGRERLVAAAKRALPALVASLGQRDLPAVTRRQVGAWLPQLNGWEQALIEALGSIDDETSRYAAMALRDRLEEVESDLVKHLGDPLRQGWCAAVLAATTQGRWLLRRQPRNATKPLLAAAGLTALPVRFHIGVVKALVISPDAAASEVLAEHLQHASPLLRTAAAKALWARWDYRSLDWFMAEHEAGRLPRLDAATLAWLGESGDARALPILKRYASIWRRLLIPPELVAAARQALATLDAYFDQFPTGALSRTGASQQAPSEAALSLWSSDESPEEAAQE